MRVDRGTHPAFASNSTHILGPMTVATMRRYTFMIEPDVLDRLEAMSARTGMSKSEQIRQGVRWWLESRGWPFEAERSGNTTPPARPRQTGASGGARKRR
jgi:hypothetical protein